MTSLRFSCCFLICINAQLYLLRLFVLLSEENLMHFVLSDIYFCSGKLLLFYSAPLWSGFYGIKMKDIIT